MLTIDVEALTASVRRALPEAEPFAAVPLLLDQVRWLDADAGLELLDRLVLSSHPSTWRFTDDRLDDWPSAVAARALAAVRALSAGEDRIEALCCVARRLTRAEQEEVLTGLLDGTYPENSWRYTKPMSRRGLITSFVRTLPAAAREAWVRAQVASDTGDPILTEVLARRDVDRLTEPAMRDLWTRIPAEPRRGVPSGYLRLAPCLPSDLRDHALATIRACPEQSTRLYHLAEFDEELTDSERTEVVLVPWNVYTRGEPRSQAQHLRRVVHHLPKVAPAVRRRWLEVVLAFEDTYPRQLGLLALLPSLSGEDRDAAVSALLAAVAQDGCFHDGARWDLVPDGDLPGYLLRLREDPYAWHRDELVAHIWSQRSASTADRVLPLLLERLDERLADTRLEIVRALTPWLAERTAGAVPRALAALSVPNSEEAPNAQYAIARVLGRWGLDE